MFVIVIIIYVLIGLFQTMPMIRKGQRKEAVLYISILSIAFTISLLLSLGVKMPSIAKPIEKLVKMVIK